MAHGSVRRRRVCLVVAVCGTIAVLPSFAWHLKPVQVLASTQGATANDAVPTWESYLSMPSVGAFAWSPKSTEIAYVAERAVFVKDVAAGGEPRRLVEGSSPAWSPDGSRIAYLAQGDLWTLPPRGGQPTRVTNDQDDERAFEWSPDGASIAFMSTRSGSQDVWVVPSAGGAPRQLTQKSMDADEVRFGIQWSPDGKSIVYVSNKAAWDRDELWVVPSAGGEPRRLTTHLRVQQDPAWSPDGKWLAVNAFRHEEFYYGDMMDLYLVNAATGEERKLNMPVVTTGLPVWSPDSRELLFSLGQRGDVNVWRVAIDDERHPTQVTGLDGAIGQYAYSADGKWIAYLYSSPVRPAVLALMPVAGGEARTVVDVSPPLKAVQAPKEINFRSFDGKYIHGFLFLPPGADKPGAKFPALVTNHGGGTNFYRNGFNAIEQLFAQKGYIVLSINYRGSSTYGRPFQDLSTKDWGIGQAHDAAVAADYLRSLPIATGKVGIYGYSYGGMMAMATIVRHPNTFDAAVAMAGIYDPALAYGARDRLGKLFTELGHGGPPDKVREVYERCTSITHVADLKTPVLVMHGEADVRVPFNQFGAIVKALKEHNKVFDSHSYPGEPHGFRRLEDRVDLYTRCERWLQKYLK